MPGSDSPVLPPQRPEQASGDLGSYTPPQPLFTWGTRDGKVLLVIAGVDVVMAILLLYIVALKVYLAVGLVPTIAAVSSEAEVLLAAGTFAALWVAVLTERREAGRDRREREARFEVTAPVLERLLDEAKVKGGPMSPIQTGKEGETRKT